MHEDIIEKLVRRVIEKLIVYEKYKIPVGVSNRHVHLSEKDFKILFGEDAELTVKSKLKQLGQFASNEVVTIRGEKGQFENVRILGPLRETSQVEISLTDSFKLGIKPKIRESGKLANTPGIEIIGPAGKIQLDSGTIVALRHIHMTPEDAKKMEVSEGEFVEVQIYGQRKAVIGNVLVRVSENYSLEMHLDTDEANAVGVKTGDYAVIKKTMEIKDVSK